MKKLFCMMFIFQMAVCSPLFACTGFFAVKDDQMLLGKNMDWPDPFTGYWIVPGNKNELGVIYFGYLDSFAISGMNEKGLVFEKFEVPPSEVLHSRSKKFFKGNLFDKVMKECTSVEEALNMISDYNLEFMRKFQVLLADKTGNSVIVEGDEMIRKKGHYQIVTNFRQSKIGSEDYPCWRYATVDWRLKEDPPLSIDLFRSLLSATSEKDENPTQYSNIYDLQNGIIYLYQFHDFDHVFKINVIEELKKGSRTYWLSSLFPKNDLKNSYLKMYVEKQGIKLQPPHFIYFKILFLGCAMIFISVIAFKILYLIFRYLLKSNKINYPASYKDSAPLEKAAHYVGLAVSLFGLIFAYAFWKYPFVINSGLPCWNAPGLTRIEQLLLLVPMIMGICTSVQIIFTILAWLKGYWTLKMRWHYTFVTLASGCIVGLLIYWNLLKFCISNK